MSTHYREIKRVLKLSRVSGDTSKGTILYYAEQYLYASWFSKNTVAIIPRLKSLAKSEALRLPKSSLS